MLKDFINRFVKKNKGMNNISSALMENTVTCFMFLSNLEGKFVADDYSRKATSDVYLYFQGANENQTKFKNLDNELRKGAKETLKKVRKITGLNRLELDENIYNDIRLEEELVSEDELKYLAFVRSINFTQDCEGINISNILKRDISEKELIEIMVILIDYLAVRDMKIEDLDKSTLLEWLYTMIAIKRFAISYNEAANFFFNNFQEGLNKKLQKERDKVKGLELKNTSIQKENEELLEQKRLLEVENKRLKEEIEKLQKDKMELTSLREFAFSLSEENEHISNELSEDTIKHINSLKGVIIGGKDSWISKMKEKLSDWNFVSVDSINFDKNILKGKIILINTNYISHAMYYKVVENCKKVNFINSRNVDLALLEINKIIGTSK